MKIISIFNNKGGVGKSTLGFHLGHALSSWGKKTLMIDLDPQCNLTVCSMDTVELHKIWEEEDSFIDDFASAFKQNTNILDNSRSIHFILKPTEDGVSDPDKLPPTVKINDKLDLIPGRLSVHKFENKIAERWSGMYERDNLAIRTVTKIRDVCNAYNELNEYDYIIIDTSPSLGVLNKVIISTVDGFFIPAQPDMFSLYGVRNIGNSLDIWQKEFNNIYSLLPEEKRNKFPKQFVQFLGFCIYNAKKYTKTTSSPYNLAEAHYNYVRQMPEAIKRYIKENNRLLLNEEMIETPIGHESDIMHTHNTFPAVAQALNCPMWEVPDKYQALTEHEIEEKSIPDVNTGNFNKYRDTKDRYKSFAGDLLKRIDLIKY